MLRNLHKGLKLPYQALILTGKDVYKTCKSKLVVITGSEIVKIE